MFEIGCAIAGFAVGIMFYKKYVIYLLGRLPITTCDYCEFWRESEGSGGASDSRRFNEIPCPPRLKEGTPPEGYMEYWSIEDDAWLVSFFVSNPVWNELQESKEWEAFRGLLESRQEEFARRNIQG